MFNDKEAKYIDQANRLLSRLSKINKKIAIREAAVSKHHKVIDVDVKMRGMLEKELAAIRIDLINSLVVQSRIANAPVQLITDQIGRDE